MKGLIRDKEGGETEYTATVTLLPPGAATDSNLCYYDYGLSESGTLIAKQVCGGELRGPVTI